jgi:uncharacterized membrane protein
VNTKILTPRCLKCHSDAGGNQGSLNLESYDQVSRHLESIKNRTIIDNSMPPKMPLTANEKVVLQNWINSELSKNGSDHQEEKVKIKFSRIKN